MRQAMAQGSDIPQIEHEICHSSDALYALQWGDWVGREQDYYRQCHALVTRLHMDDVLRICGADLVARLHMLEASFDILRTGTIPETLHLNDLSIRRTRHGVSYVRSYSPYDPLILEDELLEILPLFDGRTVTRIRDELLGERQISVDDALLQRLVDYDVLAAAKERAAQSQDRLSL